MNYIPLQVQSGYSFLESSLKVEDIITHSISNRIPFACCAEKENMYSFPILYSQCTKNNLKPIFGVGLEVKINDASLLIYVYIKNENGYRSLCKLINDERTIESISKHSDGLILIIPTLSNTLMIENIEDYQKLSRLIYQISSSFEDTYLGIEY